MLYDLYRELAALLSGTDCTATAHWLQERMHGEPCCKRAAVFWQHADEATQTALYDFMGFGERTLERCPVAQCIGDDFQYVAGLVNRLELND